MSAPATTQTMSAVVGAYKNVTISGLPGCGSTTLLRNLREALEPKGWHGFSGGEFMRAYAAEKGLFDDSNKLHHDATVYGDEFDRQVDLGVREKVQTQEGWIIESWLSGFFAQQVPGTLKVLMTCSADAVRIDRIINRDGVDVEMAKQHLHERKEKNETKWRRLYADLWKEFVVQPGTLPADAVIDFWNPTLYDLVIDTFSTSRTDALDQVLHTLALS
jgi:cytidylate kinase